MLRTRQSVTATVLAALLSGTAAQAMQIPQYDKMDYRDQGDYETLLVKVAYDDLTARGQPDQAEKLLSFFEDKSSNGGIKQFDKNLQLVREVNQKNAADPNNKTASFEVEHAMVLTLKHDGIQVSVATLLAGGKDFKPKYPTQKTGAAHH